MSTLGAFMVGISLGAAIISIFGIAIHSYEEKMLIKYNAELSKLNSQMIKVSIMLDTLSENDIKKIKEFIDNTDL